MSSCLSLRQIFHNDADFAWRLLQAECEIHTKRDLRISDITAVSELYMRAVERLNSMQDPREGYFSQKMQELMAKPFVIRCFNSEGEGRRNEREFKRKQIEQILCHQNQKANPQRLHHMISQYGEKQKKIKIKIEKIIEGHQKNLEQRIKKRASLRPDRLSYIESIETLSDEKEKSSPVLSLRNFNPENEHDRRTTMSQTIQINSP